MAQFNVYEIGLAAAPYVVDIQSDLPRELSTRVVIPLVRPPSGAAKHMKALHPRLEIDGEVFGLRTSEIAAVSINKLEGRCARLNDEQRLKLIQSIDFLIQGV